MNLIIGKKPSDAARSETVDLICSKTGLKNQEVVLLIDLFSFFIRREIIEQGFSYVYSLGKFYVKPFSHRLYGTKYHLIDFVAADDLKERIKGTNKTDITRCSLTKDDLEIVKKFFGLNSLDTKYLFRLFVLCISIFLKKYRVYRIPRLGSLNLVQNPELAKSGVSKRWNTSHINIDTVKFTTSDPFFRELNKKINQFYMYDRLRQMFVVSNVSRDISRTTYKVDYDYKKAPRPKR